MCGKVHRYRSRRIRISRGLASAAIRSGWSALRLSASER